MITTEIQTSIQDHQLWAKHIICIMLRHLVAKCNVAPDLHSDYYYNPYNSLSTDTYWKIDSNNPKEVTTKRQNHAEWTHWIGVPHW